MAQSRPGDLRQPGEPAPLSTAQQRLWVQYQLRPDSTEYNLQLAYRLRGRLDLDAVQAAVDATVRRHEVLRTVVAEWPGRGPLQLVLPFHEAPAHHVDLPGATVGEAMAWVGDEATTRFAPGMEPPVRFAVARLGPEDTIIALTLHHIAFDGWSAALVVRELTHCYAALCTGRPVMLAPLQATYSDYALWERAEVQQRRDDLLNWWRADLDGLDELALVTDRPGYGAGGRAAVVERPIERLTADRLKGVARTADVTLFTVLLAGVQGALYRQTWQSDFGLGVPVDQRTDERLTHLVGCFVNTLCLRSDVRPGIPFVNLVAQVGRRLTSALGHQLLPFEDLVREVRPPRARNRTPLFRVFCAMLETTPSTIDLPGLEATPIVSNAERDARFDLSITFSTSGDHLSVSLEYSRAIYDASTVEHLADQLLTMLRWVAVQPELRVDDVPLMSRGEADRLLRAGNHGSVTWCATATRT